MKSDRRANELLRNTSSIKLPRAEPRRARRLLPSLLAGSRYAEADYPNAMKRLLLLLYVAATLTLTPLILSMMAWGGGPMKVFAVFGWIGLFIAALVGLKWPSPSAVIGLASAGSIWAGLVDGVGNLLVFHPQDGSLSLVLLLQSLLAVAAAGVSLWILFRGRIGRRKVSYVQSLRDLISADESKIPVPEWHRSELKRRLREREGTDAESCSWDEVRSDLRHNLNSDRGD